MNTEIYTQNELFIANWKSSPNGDATANLLRCLMTGKNPYRGFTPITNPVKLANGQTAWQARDEATSILKRRLKLMIDGKLAPSQWGLSSAEQATWLLEKMG